MTIHFENESTNKLDFDYEKLIHQVVEECLDHEECTYEVDLSVLLTDDDEIREINREYREKDAATDVLSFPSNEYDTPGDFDKFEDDITSFDPESGELLLGDIVISVERAIAQAQEYGHSIKREVAFLTAHSMFHLFGYDHMEEDERIRMEEKQNNVLEKLEIFR